MMLFDKSKTRTTGRWTGICISLSVLLICAAVGVAEDAVVPAEPMAADQAVVQPAPEQAVEAAPADTETVQPILDGQSIQTISFRKDMPIKDALRMLAQMYQKNIVPSAKVDGIVTVSNLYDVTFEEALQAILGTHKYEIKGNFIKIYTNEEFMQDKTRFENATIPLYYINADEAQKLATPLLSEFGQLGVTSPAKLDTTPGQGGDSLAIQDRLVISDYPENIAKIRQMLAEVDVEPMQVLIEVTVLEAKLTENTKFGIDFDTLDASVTGLGDEGISQSAFTQPGLTNEGLNIGILNDHIRIFVHALESITDTTVLANPKVLALNKQAGKIHIGDEKGYKSQTTVSEGGTATEEIKFLETGTLLEFRPFIGKDGLIRMEIYPEQSNGVVDAITGLPAKTMASLKSNIMVRSGQTVVIGGLFQEETELDRGQTPLLGDVPIVGNLFKRVNDTSGRKELIVLLTPHIINKPEDADGAERLEDVYQLAYQARQNLTWMSRAKIDEQRYARAVKLYRQGDLDAAMAALNCPYDIKRNYLEEIRLRERILRETQPGQMDSLERIMLQNLEKEDSGKWFRL